MTEPSAPDAPHVSLYIGHHKVGSTSLQVFLSQNYARLARAGILYPFSEMRGAAHAAMRMMRGDRAEVLGVNVREPHSALAYRMMSETMGFPVPQQFQMLPMPGQMLHAIRSQVATMRPKGVVLCSEAFSNFGAFCPDQVDRICQQFPQSGFTLYCALRRPDEYMVSWHCQRIKVGEPCDQLLGGAWKSYLNTIHFDYRLAVEVWMDKVPGQNKVLRNYADIVASGGSEPDFMAHSGLSFPDDLIPAVSANKSLPLAVTEIARRANAALPRPEAHHLVQFLMGLDAATIGTPSPQVEMFGASARGRLHERFLPIHDWLSAAAGTAAFFPDLARMLDTRPVPEPVATRLALDNLTPDLTQSLPEAPRDFLRGLRSSFRP